MSTDLTVAEQPTVQTLVRPIVTPAALIENHKAVAALVTEALEFNTDYGIIPGTGTKPTLLKPGAERLVKAFGCVARYHIVESEKDHNFKVEWQKRKKKWNNAYKGDKSYTHVEENGTALGLYRYVVRCELQRLDMSDTVGEGLGSCSTMESKYVDRPRDSENTALKMAQKRALVAAVLNAFGLSDRFTQDVEDLPGHDEPIVVEEEPAEPIGKTEAQSAYFAKLIKSSVWSEDERAEQTAKVDAIPTAAAMKSYLDAFVPEFNKRQEAKKAAKKKADESDPGASA